ncbi:ammonium transporter [uncultured Ruminococcus sp.]|uniref:ammonium transporter n=2 Tax=uncultured Ruminococcus sp. TaxID=165186 RepID=UPI0029426520|nr:ammonium transporter [uncultured Ruminococcus sp.]
MERCIIMDETTILEMIGGEVYGVWFLVGAALVFFMQCGFAMVEAGFTRAKNTGNIIMKNLMDFCLGTVVFILIGFGLLCGEDLVGFIGKPGFDIFSDYANFDWSSFVFNLVFCATTATIVSGSMAERTKFASYCIYSVVLSAVIYPVEAHWVWGGGWLSQLATPFHDFAGSGVIHMVGGLSALIGAAILGPRIGKFTKTKDGKVKVNAIPGHSITIGALGCFILWFGWYGFNGAAATSVDQLGSIFLTTTIAPAVATVVCMIFTWVKYGKPDVSMCLNASLAGLVAITAGCDVLDGLGAVIVGVVSGFLVCFGVWFLDYVLHIDDPVGAVAVHFFNGLWGVIAVGLFATTSAPQSACSGLFYGGGFALLGTQLLGVLCILAWTAVMITITFLIIKHTMGLRASAEEEVLGLDITEHDLQSAYADFMPSTAAVASEAADAAATGVTIPESEMIVKPANGGKAKLTKISIMCNPEKLDALQATLASMGVNGVTVTHVMGYGSQKGNSSYYRGVKTEGTKLLKKVKVEAVVAKIPPQKIIDAVKKVLYTGQIGDGKIFVYDVEDVVKIRTGETGYDALQDI